MYSVQKLCFFSLLALILTVALPGGASEDRSRGKERRAKAVREVLAGEGLSKSSIDQVAAGYESLDRSPEKHVAPMPERHFLNNRIRLGKKYIRGQIKAALTLAGSADKSSGKKALSLYHLGKAIHTAQDFYFNSNYIELMLSKKRPLRPVNWNNIPTGTKSGYIWWKTAINNEANLGRSVIVRNIQSQYRTKGKSLVFYPQKVWENRRKNNSYKDALDYAINPWHDLLSIELTKESPGSYQGRVLITDGAYRGRTIHSVASSLARKETARQWRNFSIDVKKRYGRRATPILNALAGKSAHAQAPSPVFSSLR